jgi:hypothetical protein
MDLIDRTHSKREGSSSAPPDVSRVWQRCPARWWRRWTVPAEPVRRLRRARARGRAWGRPRRWERLGRCAQAYPVRVPSGAERGHPPDEVRPVGVIADDGPATDPLHLDVGETPGSIETRLAGQRVERSTHRPICPCPPLLVEVMGMTTRPPPQLKVTVPPPTRAAPKAASVQLAGVPLPTIPAAWAGEAAHAASAKRRSRCRVGWLLEVVVRGRDLLDDLGLRDGGSPRRRSTWPVCRGFGRRKKPRAR